jgi:hypothetical protein
MSKQIQERILNHLKSEAYRPRSAGTSPSSFRWPTTSQYELFKEALRELDEQAA